MIKKDAVFFITGCSSGFGREFATVALERGYRVIATARNIADLDYLRDNKNALAVVCDITKPDAIVAVVNRGVECFDHIDVLINNAGVNYLTALEDSDDVLMRRMFETDLFGTINVTKTLLPFIKKSGGVVVNISSVDGFDSTYIGLFYGIIKAGFDAMTRSLINGGVRAMSVNPGPFETRCRENSLENSTHEKYTGGMRPAPRIVADALFDTLESDKRWPMRLVIGETAFPRYRRVLKQMEYDRKYCGKFAINHSALHHSFWWHLRHLKF